MSDSDLLVADLVGELPTWLPTQRWFAGKDRPVTGVRPLATTTLLDGDPLLLHVIVEVVQHDRSEPYQLLIASRQAQLPDVPASALIGLERGLTCYEASGDADLTARLLDLIATESRAGALRFELEPGVELTTGLRSRPITAEQSNTSLVFGSQYILKLFRRLTPGTNKDLLLHRALRDVGCTHVAEPLGSISGELDGDTVTIGMLQRFLPDAVDGWTMATTSVRDLMADPELPPAELGGDFAGEAQRLGHTVAQVHEDLARALGRQPATPDAFERTVDAMTARLDSVTARVRELEAYAPALRERFESIRTLPSTLTSMQYVHGDLHLGQVLRTVAGWLLLDFEGEPASTPEERATLRSPLRDVAGMLRSFDYAAQQLLVGQDNDTPLLAERAVEWAERNREAFCDGYAEGGLGDPRDQAALLRAFELDKAVYEVSYEHANRPEWLMVPLASIARITTEGD